MEVQDGFFSLVKFDELQLLGQFGMIQLVGFRGQYSASFSKNGRVYRLEDFFLWFCLNHGTIRVVHFATKNQLCIFLAKRLEQKVLLPFEEYLIEVFAKCTITTKNVVSRTIDTWQRESGIEQFSC